MKQNRHRIEADLVGKRIRRFKTCSGPENDNKVEIRVLFQDDKKVYWIVPIEGHYFESVWVNTGKSHDAITRVSQEYINKNMIRVKLHGSSHVLSMIDIKREDGNAPTAFALETLEETDD